MHIDIPDIVYYPAGVNIKFFTKNYNNIKNFYAGSGSANAFHYISLLS